MTAPLNLDALERLLVSPVEFQELWLGGGDGERDVVLDDPEFERLMQVYRAVPALIQEVRRLTAENERLSEQAHRAWQNAAQTRDILREATS